MSAYPDRWHPVYMLIDALADLGADVEFVRDERTGGAWGFICNGVACGWFIDNRHHHERVTDDPAAAFLLDNGGLVMHAQPPDRDRVGGYWLPLAVSPGYDQPSAPMPKLWDCAFVGFIRTEERADFLADINAHYSVSSLSGVFGQAAVDTYWKARVGLNVPTSWGTETGRDSANMRCFEILATGVPLVTSYEPWLEQLGLIPGITYMPYTSIADALAAIKHCIEHPEIGERGAMLAREKHTYYHRAQTVLQWLGEM